MNLYTFEVFEKVAAASTPEAKVTILKENATPAVQNVIVGTFGPIEWLLPDTPPSYTPSDFHNHPTDFRRCLDELRWFVKSGPGEETLKFKREARFIRLLEGVHPKDAEMILLMVARKSPAKGLTKKIAMEAFPTLFRN
jgi:hypothetical protein